MNTIQRTAVFAEGLDALADRKGKARIVARIEYFMRLGTVVYLLLCEGDKSTQKADIAAARRMARQVKEAAKSLLARKG